MRFEDLVGVEADQKKIGLSEERVMAIVPTAR
jgi:hypothetical protein